MPSPNIVALIRQGQDMCRSLASILTCLTAGPGRQQLDSNRGGILWYSVVLTSPEHWHNFLKIELY